MSSRFSLEKVLCHLDFLCPPTTLTRGRVEIVCLCTSQLQGVNALQHPIHPPAQHNFQNAVIHSRPRGAEGSNQVRTDNRSLTFADSTSPSRVMLHIERICPRHNAKAHVTTSHMFCLATRMDIHSIHGNCQAPEADTH